MLDGSLGRAALRYVAKIARDSGIPVFLDCSENEEFESVLESGIVETCQWMVMNRASAERLAGSGANAKIDKAGRLIDGWMGVSRSDESRENGVHGGGSDAVCAGGAEETAGTGKRRREGGENAEYAGVVCGAGSVFRGVGSRKRGIELAEGRFGV